MKKFLNNIFAIIFCIGIVSSGCSYSSKLNKVLKHNEIAVPEGKDSFCKSVILSSLLPVIDNDSKFDKRKNKLFGENKVDIDRVKFAKNVKDIEYLRGDKFNNLVNAFCNNNEIDLDEDDIDKELKEDLCNRMNIQINEFFFNEKFNITKFKKYIPTSQDDDDDDSDDSTIAKPDYSINIIRDYPDTTERTSKKSKKHPKRKKHYRSPIPDIYNQFLEILNNIKKQDENSNNNYQDEQKSYDPDDDDGQYYNQFLEILNNMKKQDENSNNNYQDEQKSYDPNDDDSEDMSKNINRKHSDDEKNINIPEEEDDFENISDKINPKHSDDIIGDIDDIQYEEEKSFQVEDTLENPISFSDDQGNNQNIDCDYNIEIEEDPQSITNSLHNYKEQLTSKLLQNLREEEEKNNQNDENQNSNNLNIEIPNLSKFKSSIEKDLAYYFNKLDSMPDSFIKEFKELYYRVLLKKIRGKQKAQISFNSTTVKFDSNDVKKRIRDLMNKLKNHPNGDNIDENITNALNQAKNNDWDEVEIHLAGAKRIIEPLDVELLKFYVYQAKLASHNIEGEDIIMFIGRTGAGKSTTIQYLAGSKMKKIIDSNGLDHITYDNITHNKDLDTVTTSAQTRSETRYVSKVEVNLEERDIDSENDIDRIVLCDCPGLEDSNGPEVDISNSIGIISMLDKVNSVKPVILIPFEELIGKAISFKKFISSLIDFVPNIKAYKNSFMFLISRALDKDLKNDIAPILRDIKKNMSPEFKSNQQYKSILTHILKESKKSDSRVRILNPLDEYSRDPLLEYILDLDAIETPKENFNPSISNESKGQIKAQIDLFDIYINRAIDNQQISTAEYYVTLWKYLIDLLPNNQYIGKKYEVMIVKLQQNRIIQIENLKKRIDLLKNSKKIYQNDLSQIKDDLFKISDSTILENNKKIVNEIMIKIADLLAQALCSLQYSNLEKNSTRDAHNKIEVITKYFPILSFACNLSEKIILVKKLKLRKDLDNFMKKKEYIKVVSTLSKYTKTNTKMYKKIGISDICQQYLNQLINISSSITKDIIDIILPEREHLSQINIHNINLVNDKNIIPLSNIELSSIKQKFDDLSRYSKKLTPHIKDLNHLIKIKENYTNVLNILCSYVKEWCNQITSKDKEDNHTKLSKRTKKKYYNGIRKLRENPEIKLKTQKYYSAVQRVTELDREILEDKLKNLFSKDNLNNNSFKLILTEILDQIEESDEFIDHEFSLKSWKGILRYLKSYFDNLEEMIEENPSSTKDLSTLKLYNKIITLTKDIRYMEDYIPRANNDIQIDLRSQLNTCIDNIFKKVHYLLKRNFNNISKYCDLGDIYKSVIITLESIARYLNQKKEIENQISKKQNLETISLILAELKTDLSNSHLISNQDIEKIFKDDSFRKYTIEKYKNKSKDYKGSFYQFSIKRFYTMIDFINNTEKIIIKIPQSNNKDQIISLKDFTKYILENSGKKYGTHLYNQINTGFANIKNRFAKNRNMELMNIQDIINLEQEASKVSNSIKILLEIKEIENDREEDDFSDEPEEYFNSKIIDEIKEKSNKLYLDLSSQLINTSHNNEYLASHKTHIEFAKSLSPLDELLSHQKSFYKLFEKFHNTSSTNESQNINQIYTDIQEMNYFDAHSQIINLIESSKIDNKSKSYLENVKKKLYISLKNKLKKINTQIIILQEPDIEQTEIIDLESNLSKLATAKELFFDNSNQNILSKHWQEDLQKYEKSIKIYLRDWMQEIFTTIRYDIENLQFYEAEIKLAMIKRFSTIFKDLIRNSNDKNGSNDNSSDTDEEKNDNSSFDIQKKHKDLLKEINKKLNKEIKKYSKIKFEKLDKVYNPYSSANPKILFDEIQRAKKFGSKYRSAWNKIRQDIEEKVRRLLDHFTNIIPESKARNIQSIYSAIHISLPKEMQENIQIIYENLKCIYEQNKKNWKLEINKVIQKGTLDHLKTFYIKSKNIKDKKSMKLIKQVLSKQINNLSVQIKKDLEAQNLKNALKNLDEIKKYKEKFGDIIEPEFGITYKESSEIIDKKIKSLNQDIMQYSEKLENIINSQKTTINFKQDIQNSIDLFDHFVPFESKSNKDN